MGEDVFSGQIIVACVIVAFIAAFLLREWVMANQPNVHVDGAGVNQPAVAPAPNVDAERLQAVQDVIARFQEINERREREGLGAGNGEDGPLIPLRLELRRELGLPPIEPLPIGLETARSDDSSDDIRRAREAGEALYSEGSFTPRLERAGSARLDRDEEEASSRESSPTGSDEEASAGLIRRRVWSSETYSGEASELAGSSKIPGLPAHFAHASQRNSPSASTSEATSPLLPATLPRSASNDFGIESASEGELENEPAAAPMIGPIPAPAAANPARRAARAHDLGNDSDTDDDLEDDLFGPVDPPAGARAMQNDAVLFEGDENPDDLFFEADLQGILEAVGIQGPILALLQNVALVSLLIACLLVVAIWLPLMFGKTIAAVSLPACPPYETAPSVYSTDLSLFSLL